MPQTREEIIKEFEAASPGREITEQDIANATKHGTDIFKKSFAQIGGQPGDEATANQQGQAGLPTGPEEQAQDRAATAVEEAPTKEFSDQEELEMMTSGEADTMQVLEKMLQAKQREEAPYAEKKAKVGEKIQKISIRDYKNLRPEDARAAMQNDYARLVGQRDYLDTQKEDLDNSLENVMSAARDIYGAELNALGLRIESEKDARAYAFDPMILVSATEPPANLPAAYHADWKAAAVEAKRQQALSERRTGGSGTSASTKWNTAVADAIEDLDKGALEWGTAWDILKAKFPEKSNEEIDAALGGSYGEEGPTGRAESTYGGGEADITEENIYQWLSTLTPEEKADTATIEREIQSAGFDPAKFTY